MYLLGNQYLNEIWKLSLKNIKGWNKASSTSLSKKFGAWKECWSWLWVRQSRERGSLMNYCCTNSELYPVMLSVISLMLQVLFFYFTKNVIFDGRTFGHGTKNGMWLDVLQFSSHERIRKNCMIEHKIWMDRLSQLSMISLSVYRPKWCVMSRVRIFPLESNNLHCVLLS